MLAHARTAVLLALAVVLIACGSQSPEGTGDPGSDPTPEPTKTAAASVELGASDQVALRISAKVGPEPEFGTGSPPVKHASVRSGSSAT